MEYLLLVVLFVLFCLSYAFSGKDLFAPGTMLVSVFLFSYVFCLYCLKTIPYKLHVNTIWWISSVLIYSVLIGISIHRVFLRISIYPKRNETRTISFPAAIIIFLIVLFALLSQLAYVFRNGGGSEKLTTSMMYYRNSGYYDAEKRMPFVLCELQRLVMCIFGIFAFDMPIGYEFQSEKKSADIVLQKDYDARKQIQEMEQIYSYC